MGPEKGKVAGIRSWARSIMRGGTICVVALLSVLLAACNAEADPASCPTAERVDLSNIDTEDPTLPFRYPLDVVEEHPHDAEFGEHRPGSGSNFHAAEDFWRPAGTPVSAMADGEVAFSGTMGGYGWLVIVDHPEMNLYSLYGHLSPSRWRVEPGPVAKGDLVGYLGDSWENGGSREQPLVEHLHLGVRVGQRTDYPGRGEWRWMAGWIESCPEDLGWVQPSTIIAGQTAPEGGFEPAAGVPLMAWTPEILFSGVVLWGAVVAIFFGIRRQWTVPIIGAAIVYGLLAWYMTIRGFTLLLAARVVSAGCLVAGIVIFGRRVGTVRERMRPLAKGSSEPSHPVAL